MRLLCVPAVLVLALCLVPGCSSDPTPTEPDSPGTRRSDSLPDSIAGDVTILFVGNSLTYTNDLPGMVEAVAGAAGLDVGTASVAQPNYALEDHWRSGIRQMVQRLRPDWVVMQQGPSSLPENQDNLARWADSLAAAARAVDARPALLMVWPSRDRWFALDDVRDGYRAAARGVDGHFIPAGELFRVLEADHPEIPALGPDQFHPSPFGSLAAALAVVGILLEESAEGLPLELTAADGDPVLQVPRSVAEVLYPLADSVVAAWRPGASG
jgi:hypothetical protein